jgi:hypothetical protein
LRSALRLDHVEQPEERRVHRRGCQADSFAAEAMREGTVAAESIDRYIRGENLKSGRTKEYKKARRDKLFLRQLDYYLKEYAGRPTPLYLAESLSKYLGINKIYLKREDLLHQLPVSTVTSSDAGLRLDSHRVLQGEAHFLECRDGEEMLSTEGSSPGR